MSSIDLEESPCISRNLESDIAGFADKESMTGVPDEKDISSEFESESSSESSFIDSDEEPNDNLFGKCFFVYFENLLELLRFCSQCGSPIEPTFRVFSYIGTLLKVTYVCLNNHSTTWSSQPVLKKFPLTDNALTTSVCISGNTHSTLKEISNTLNLQIMRKQTYSKIQKHYVLPVVDEAYNSLISEVSSCVQENGEAVMIGDGR